MRKIKLSLVTSVFVALTIVSFNAIQVNAQVTLNVRPTELYRFAVPGTHGGYMLTPIYSEGANSTGFIYQGVVGYAFAFYPDVAFAPPAGVRPIHRWRRILNGRLYFYYSATYRYLGAGYTYEGVRFYMYDQSINNAGLPPFYQYVPVYKIKSCYSQSKDFWYGSLTPISPNYYVLESPPDSSYGCGPEHETIGGGVYTTRGTRPGAYPQVSESNPGAEAPGDDGNTPYEVFTYDDNGDPPPSCDVNQENYCNMNGGYWESSSCFCSYY